MKTWQAPALAYQLAAEWAEEVIAARCGGTCGGHLALGKAWQELPDRGKRDVLTALSGQARGALWDLRQREGLTDSHMIELGTGFYDHQLCARARETLDILLHPHDQGAGAWQLPPCPHCTDVLAVALIAVHTSVLLRAGIADPAAVFRSLAAGVPAPREGR